MPPRASAVFLLLAALGMGWLAWTNAARPRIIVEWSTASELDTAGFNLYRSTDPAARGERINPELIPPAADPLQGADYTFRDRNVAAGQTYHYTLEEVETSGNVISHGAITATAARGGWFEGLIALLLLAAAAYLFLQPVTAG
jgi:hypothetical protein